MYLLSLVLGAVSASTQCYWLEDNYKEDQWYHYEGLGGLNEDYTLQLSTN